MDKVVKKKTVGTEDQGNRDDGDDKVKQVPLEIDTHYQMYGKHAWEVEYGKRCSICDKRIDEFGFCACGSDGG